MQITACLADALDTSLGGDATPAAAAVGRWLS